MLLPIAIVLLISSQIYWAVRLYGTLERRIPSRAVRHSLYALAICFFNAAIWYNSDRLFEFPSFGPQPNPTRLGLADASLAGTQWWLLCSMLAFVLAVPFRIAAAALRTVARIWKARRRPPERPLSPQRRHFLEHGATIVSAFPFVAGAYPGFLIEKLPAGSSMEGK